MEEHAASVTQQRRVVVKGKAERVAFRDADTNLPKIKNSVKTGEETERRRGGKRAHSALKIECNE